LGQLWSAGVDVDWAAFYSREQRRRIPLPTYPFERQRYWIDAQPQPDSGGASFDRLSRKPDPADWFYVPSWKRSVIRSEASEQGAPATNRCCLIFADECGLGALIAQGLESRSQDVYSSEWVSGSARFRKESLN